MKDSKIAIFDGKNKPFRMENVPIPDLSEGEVLVRNEYTTLCRSDLYTFTGKRTEKTPTILGHEIVGLIEKMGPDAPKTDSRGASLNIGDRVTWAIYASDPDSDMAKKGIPQKGKDLFKYGHEEITNDSNLHGGLSEYCLLRKNTPIIKIEKAIPLPVIALINCSVATVAGSLRLAGSFSGETVLVTGVGMLGVIACAMSKENGAAKVIAADIDDSRLEMACKFGVDSTINIGEGSKPLKDQLSLLFPGEKVNILLDYSGVPETMESGLSVLGIGGIAVWVGATFPSRPLQISAEQVVRGLNIIKGLHNYNKEDLVTAVEFIEDNHNRYPFNELVHDKFTLDQVNESFDYAIRYGAYRVGVSTK